MTSDSDAILRHLEGRHDDVAARNALHDALMDEQKDPVLAFGVHWLVVNNHWVFSVGGQPDRKYLIDLSWSEWGVSRMPFTGPIYGPTVAATLRVFSAYLWDCRQWVEAVFGDRPVAAPKKNPVPAVPGVQPLSPADQQSIEDMVREWRGQSRRWHQTTTVGDTPWFVPPTDHPDWSYRGHHATSTRTATTASTSTPPTTATH